MELLEYYENTWKARGTLLEAAETLTPEEWSREFDFSWRSMRFLFAHVIEVERSWMIEDIRGAKYAAAPEEEIRHLYATPSITRSRGDEVAKETRSVLAEYDPGKLGETREVKGAGGGVVHLTVEQILIHVFTHELRHQGQLQVMLRLLGKKAPNLDWF